MSTKSFIISLPIITGDQDRRRLCKSFSFGCNLQNAVMGGWMGSCSENARHAEVAGTDP